MTVRALLLLLCCLPALAQPRTQTLTEGWQARAVSAPEHADATRWFPATVPGVVQTDLCHAGLIPDPFFADNERRLQWIGTTDWEYETSFEVTAAQLHDTHQQLVFAGLDTFADVELNGTALGSTDNQFRSFDFDVRNTLHAGRNTLRVLFHSPTNRLTPYVAALPYLIPGTGYETLDREHGIYPVSHYMRKAPYGYGWDWGPRFVTQGIWQPVRLLTWSGARIASLHLAQDSVDANRVLATARLAVDSDDAGAATFVLHITAPDGHALPARRQPIQLDRGANTFALALRLDHPALWYPNGYGAPSRYLFRAELVRNARAIDQATRTTGFRSIELRRQPDQWGTSFTFVVNGIPVFAKGANFIPLDSFAPSITDDRRREILTAAHTAHMNMLRVWGGGFYESDSFYDLADELGLMIWHDFMFGGALVPGDRAFQQNVQAEAAEQVARLSDHPSMSLWCGNNEVEDAWRHWPDHLAFEKTLTPEQRERIWQDYAVMFRDILKSTVANFGNGVPYWPSSPGSNFDDVAGGKQDGDMHSWHVWSGGVPYTQYADEHPRFLSEFGFQSLPDLRTIQAFAGSETDFKSAALQNHERFVHGYERMQDYLAANFRPARDFASTVYLSQLLQAQAIQFGVETMRARRPETMGTLFWQLDDCWPVASWASIDYFGRWKALEYFAARFYAPLLIASERKGNTLAVHVVSDELKPHVASLHLRLLRFDGSVVSDRQQPLTVTALASTAASFALPAFDPAATFAVLTLEQQGSTLAANTMYFAAAKELALPRPRITAHLLADGTGYRLQVSSPTLARAVDIGFGTLDAKPDDSFFDLLPGEPRTIHIASHASLSQLEAALTLRSLADAQK